MAPKKTKITTKKAPKPLAATGSTPDAVDHGLDLAVATWTRILQAISDEADAIMAGESTSEKYDAPSRLAFLAQKQTPIVGELRKIQAARAKAAAELEHDEVLAYLRALDKAEWTHIRREVDETHASGSVL